MKTNKKLLLLALCTMSLCAMQRQQERPPVHAIPVLFQGKRVIVEFNPPAEADDVDCLYMRQFRDRWIPGMGALTEETARNADGTMTIGTLYRLRTQTSGETELIPAEGGSHYVLIFKFAKLAER